MHRHNGSGREAALTQEHMPCLAGGRICCLTASLHQVPPDAPSCCHLPPLDPSPRSRRSHGVPGKGALPERTWPQPGPCCCALPRGLRQVRAPQRLACIAHTEGHAQAWMYPSDGAHHAGLARGKPGMVVTHSTAWWQGMQYQGQGLQAQLQRWKGRDSREKGRVSMHAADAVGIRPISFAVDMPHDRLHGMHAPAAGTCGC
jgi:hypothetical protein